MRKAGLLETYSVAKSVSRFLAMKWPERTAQDFSPGNALSIDASRPRMRPEERSQSGAVLVYVLVLVVVAGLIATSYLVFVDNQRARTGRNLDQDGLRITTEQALLSLESSIRSELLTRGEVNLAYLNRTGPVAGISLSLNSQTDSGVELLQVQAFANATKYEEFQPLENQDLFGQAHALVTKIDVGITASSAIPNMRLPGLNVTDHPQIAVREIPVSQFTVFSAGDPFTLGATVFSQDIGRVFSESTLSVSGSFSSEFAIIAGQNINFQDGSLRIKDPSGNSASVTLSSDTQSQNFLPDARTSLDARIVTGSVLPVDTAALDSLYDSGNSEQVASNGLNLSLLEKQCDLVVMAQPDQTVVTPNGKQCRVAIVRGVVSKYFTYLSTASPTEAHSQAPPVPQAVVFAAAQNKQNPSQIILTLDYNQLHGVQLSSVFLVVQNSTASNPVANAVILIRGAQALTGPLSIVSPHPIIIAGDFNTEGGNDGPPPASIITPANLQTAASDWGSDVFGSF